LGLIWNANKNAPEKGFVFELEKLTVTGTARSIGTADAHRSALESEKGVWNVLANSFILSSRRVSTVRYRAPEAMIRMVKS